MSEARSLALLFVYGTLRASLAPRSVRPLLRDARVLGAASVAGRLYDLGAYPGARLHADAGAVERVHGELLELADPAAALMRLDRYEGVDVHDRGRGLFRRVVTQARTDDGVHRACWVYEVVTPPPESARIADGRWAPRDRARDGARG